MNRFMLMTAAIWGFAEIVRLGLDFGSLLAKDFLSGTDMAIFAAKDITALLAVALMSAAIPGGAVANLQGLLLVALIGLIFYVAGLIIVLVQALKRAGDLVLTIIYGSFAALGIGSNNGSFRLAVSDLQFHMFVLGLQLFVLKLSVAKVLQGFLPTKNPVIGIFWGIGLILTVIGVPKWLERYTHGGASATNLGAITGFIMGRLR